MSETFRTQFTQDYVAQYGPRILPGKIALEEHYESPDWEATGDPQNETARNQEAYFEAVKSRLHSAEQRIADMDRNGVEVFVMSLTQPGVQEVLDTGEAVKRPVPSTAWSSSRKAAQFTENQNEPPVPVRQAASAQVRPPSWVR